MVFINRMSENSIEEDHKELDSKEEQDLQTIVYEPERSWWCCCTLYKDRSKFLNVMQNVDLPPLQKQMIESRYLYILQNFQKRARNYGIMFYIGHIIITVGSLFVPALLSIQNSDKSFVYESGRFTVHIYWATFILSLLVTIFNGILTLFKIDRKYYFLNTTLERLRSEGWQYVGLTGRYSGQLLKDGRKPTHRNQYMYFAHYIEKIKMRQVEEEYYNTDEKTAQTPNGNQVAAQITKSDLYPPSPDESIHSMPRDVPPPVKDVVSSLVKSHKKVEEDPMNMTQTMDLRRYASSSPAIERESPPEHLSHRMNAQPQKPPLKELLHPTAAKITGRHTALSTIDSEESEV